MVKSTDSLSRVRYLVSYETGIKSKKGNPEISFKELSSSDFEQIKEKHYWVDLDIEKAGKFRLYRTLSFIGVLLSLFFIVKTFFSRPLKRQVIHNRQGFEDDKG